MGGRAGGGGGGGGGSYRVKLGRVEKMTGIGGVVMERFGGSSFQLTLRFQHRGLPAFSADILGGGREGERQRQREREREKGETPPPPPSKKKKKKEGQLAFKKGQLKYVSQMVKLNANRVRLKTVKPMSPRQAQRTGEAIHTVRHRGGKYYTINLSKKNQQQTNKQKHKGQVANTCLLQKHLLLSP